MRTARAIGIVVGLTVTGSFVACGGNDDPYKPVPAFSGKKATLPSVPSLPSTPIKQGDAFTVYGAVHHLNSSIHSAEVTAKDISIVGYIVDMNMRACEGTNTKNCAPACAIHKTGKADPEGCTTEVPTFVIADTKGDTATQYKIRVMGLSSNFANLYEAVNAYKNLKQAPDEKQVYKDVLWATEAPYPLPMVGAKIKITGKYGVNFQKGSQGIASDPKFGIMTFGKMETLEEAPEKLVLELPKK